MVGGRPPPRGTRDSPGDTRSSRRPLSAPYDSLAGARWERCVSVATGSLLHAPEPKPPQATDGGELGVLAGRRSSPGATAGRGPQPVCCDARVAVRELPASRAAERRPGGNERARESVRRLPEGWPERLHKVCISGDEDQRPATPQPRRDGSLRLIVSDPQTGVAPGWTRGRKVRSKCR